MALRAVWGFGPRGASHGLDTLLLLGTADLVGEVTRPVLTQSQLSSGCRNSSGLNTWTLSPRAIPAGLGSEQRSLGPASNSPSLRWSRIPRNGRARFGLNCDSGSWTSTRRLTLTSRKC